MFLQLQQLPPLSRFSRSIGLAPMLNVSCGVSVGSLETHIYFFLSWVFFFLSNGTKKNAAQRSFHFLGEDIGSSMPLKKKHDIEKLTLLVWWLAVEIYPLKREGILRRLEERQSST